MTALTLILAAFALGDVAPPPPPDLGEIEKALREVADGKRHCRELKFHYGWTQSKNMLGISLTGNHVTIFRQQSGSKPESFYGKLTDTECRSIARAAVTGKLWTVKSDQTRTAPKEAQVMVRMGVNHRHAGQFEVHLYESSVPKAPAFVAVQKRIVEVASRLSGGKVSKPGVPTSRSTR